MNQSGALTVLPRLGRVIAASALLAVSAAHAQDDDPWRWRRSDTMLESAYLALHLVDWSQSLDIAARAPTERLWVEGNPFLGPAPSRARVNVYFAATLVGHIAIARVLPRPYRQVWQCVTIGFETSAVGVNFASGVRLAF